MNTCVRNFFAKLGTIVSIAVFALLVAVILCAPPAFAAANSNVLQSVTVNIQEIVSGFTDDQNLSAAPMSLEEGIEALTGSGLTVVEVSTGIQHSLAILSDGTLWAWGFNTHGALGLGNTTDALVPTQVGTDDDWDSISAGANFSLAIRAGGSLWAWGQRGGGQLGLGDTANIFVPTQVQPGTTWSSASAGGYHSLGVRTDGSLWAWGDGSEGQLGNGSRGSALVPVQVVTPATVTPGTTWESISASFGSHNLAVRSDGTLWVWGHESPQLGLGVTGDSVLVPTQIQPGTIWNSVSAGWLHSQAIRSDGTLWAWGAGGSGRLGLGSTSSVNTPTQVGTDDDWDSISAGGAANVALKTDGSLWIWGSGNQMSFNSTDNVLEPTQVQPGTTWESASIHSHVLAMRNDSTLWSWGSGFGGRIGIGTTANVLVPTLVHAQATANTPADGATGVLLTTDSITITFNRVMNENFGDVTVSGATVDMAGATWTHGTNTSTITVPITITASPGTTHTVSAPGLLTTDGGFAGRGVSAPNAGSGAFPAMNHNFSFTTETPPLPMQDTLTKTLRLPANTTIPTAAFNFTFTPVQVALSTSPAINSVPVASVPAISNQTISFDSSSTFTEAAGIRTTTGTLSLSTLVNNLTFPHAGTFVWNIEEVQATTPPTTTPSTMTFSQARYEMRVLVDRYLDIAAIELFVRVQDTSAQELGAKVDAALFTNTYSTWVTNPLYVRKTTEGRFANLSQNFNFTLTLTNPAIGGPIGTVTANVVAVNDASNTSIRTVSLTAGANTFTLAHNERLLIPTLPAGTTFSVSEAPATEYTAGAVVTLGGVAQTPPYQNANVNTILTTGTYTIASSGNNSAHFTNVHSYTTPTGLTLANAPYIAAVLGLVALTMLLVVRNRRRIEELPVV